MTPIDMARDATAAGRAPASEGDSGGGPTQHRWVVLYDPGCGFCRWSLAQLLRLDRRRRLQPLPLGTPAADQALADLTPEQRAASWHLLSPSGELSSAGAAAPPLLRLLPAGGALAAALAAMPEVTERAYRWVADHRSLFSKLVPAGAKRRADDLIARRS